jgi:uncharacterized alkaline shock family protein YloU
MIIKELYKAQSDDNMLDQFEELDAGELELPETIFIRDIENRVFQAIAIKCLASIEGIALLEGTFIDNLLGREGLERVKGVYIEQDAKNHSVSVRLDVNVSYGISLPGKAEEIQNKIVAEVSRLTGLHVACVHVVFKNLLPDAELTELLLKAKPKDAAQPENKEDAYAEEF